MTGLPHHDARNEISVYVPVDAGHGIEKKGVQDVLKRGLHGRHTPCDSIACIWDSKKRRQYLSKYDICIMNREREFRAFTFIRIPEEKTITPVDFPGHQ